ncbi:barstar family protein [Frankia tisae]|uniref:barstar family protein n=1 Tax=Frankia tisae TaxID=2950104 RepID=UPI0021C2210A|nr:barstar family protein [Frankia tisae]
MTWIQPPAGLIPHSGVPLLVGGASRMKARDYYQSAGGTVVELAVADVQTVKDLIDALKSLLPFPEWCGSSWDALDDAFEELREGWSFPVIIIVDGLPELLGRNRQLGLQTVIRFNGLTEAFSSASAQLEFIYVDDGAERQ